ncbi:MAG: efflux RND transporter permease subunit [Solirubrobacteraceae bacterium]
MVRRIVGSSVKFRLLVILGAAALMVIGVSQLHKAPVDVLPEFTPPVVEVQTESLGLSGTEVEQLITVPMEQDLLNGVQGANVIRSHSVPGVSSIDLVFDRGTDILHARQLVQERLTQAHALPNVSRPPQMLQPISSTNRVMMIGLDSRKLSPIELSVLARWTVRPRLLGLPGVANVAIWGQRDRQLQVLIDPARLRTREVDMSDLIDTVGNAQLVSPLSYLDASTPGTGGFIEGPNQRLSIRHILPFGKPAALGQVPIENEHGLRLGDVAKVVEGHQPLIGDAVVHGGDGLLLVVEKLPGANTLQVTHEVQSALDDLRPGLTGVHTDSSVFRPASFIQAALHNLTLILIIAGALVVLALAAFLRRWRAVLVSVISIPVSLIVALFVLDLLGGTINALVVAGLLIAVGVVVDDAISSSERLLQRLREARETGSDKSATQVLLEASGDTRGPMAYATLIVLLAVVPVLVSSGTSAIFVQPMVRAYALAVLSSLVVALTVTPALTALLVSKLRAKPDESRLASRLGVLYEELLTRVIRTPRAALLAVCAVGLIPLAVVPWIGQPDRPSFKDRDLRVRLTANPGTSLPAMNRIATGTSHALLAVPGVRDAGAELGRAVTSDQIVDSNSGEIWLKMDPSADYDKTLARVRRVVGHTPGVRSDVTTYESEKTASVFSSSSRQLDVRLFGHDYGVLRRQAGNVKRVVAGVSGVHNPRVHLPTQEPTLEVQVDLAAASRHQVKPGDVRRAAAILLSGITVGDFFEEQKVFEVVVRGVPSIRKNVNSVRNLLIETPAGTHVRLGDVARVRVRPNPLDIRHDAVSRYVDVTADVRGRDMGAVEQDVGRQIRRMTFPLEYHAEVVNNTIDAGTSHGRFLTYALAAAIGMFLLLQAAFRSWRLASLVFSMLPLALLGGLLVALATGNLRSLGAYGGLLAVFALAARQAIMLVARLRDHERENGEFMSLLVLRGARERLWPTVTSALTTGLAVLPFVAIGAVAGNEITRPMGEVILGGLVTSTALTLFVLPAAYLQFRGPEPQPIHDEADDVLAASPVDVHA